jgi:putative nucleotidyltransferase with HDIG domain
MNTPAYLLSLLHSLDGVRQNPRHHPEGDALYHSLQVFSHALEASDDPELWAAALLHDVGKATTSRGHAQVGAQALRGALSERACWLIEHHMDLLYHPRRTRERLKGTDGLRDLEALRRWDMAGRDPHAVVMQPRDAVALLWRHLEGPAPP